jgi:RNA polymerase sigma-70 factor (ECF subfamily)
MMSAEPSPGPFDTALGGPGRAFPETSWSLVSRLQATGEERYREALGDLCRRYWKPAFAYVRSAWAKSTEEAKDLTQAFFLWLVEEPALRSYEPARGGFRPFLKTLLRRFVGHQEASLQRLKRGGGRALVPLDGVEALVADPAAADPERAFERAWITELVEQAIGRVRARRQSQGDPVAFRVYDEYELAPATAQPTYRDLAERHGLREADVRALLFSVREEIRSEVRRELARVTADERELDDEWRALLGA